MLFNQQKSIKLSQKRGVRVKVNIRCLDLVEMYKNSPKKLFIKMKKRYYKSFTV